MTVRDSPFRASVLFTIFWPSCKSRFLDEGRFRRTLQCREETFERNAGSYEQELKIKATKSLYKGKELEEEKSDRS